MISASFLGLQVRPLAFGVIARHLVAAGGRFGNCRQPSCVGGFQAHFCLTSRSNVCRARGALEAVSAGTPRLSSSASSNSVDAGGSALPAPSHGQTLEAQTSSGGNVGASSSGAKASLRELLAILRPESLRLKLAFCALLASSSVSLSYPVLIGRLVDLFGDAAGGLVFIGDHVYLCGGVVAFGGIATFLRLYLIETSIERVAARLRQELFGEFLRRDMAFFDKHKTGELVNRLSNDITVTSRVIIDASAGVRSMITACVGTGMVFHLAPPEMMIGMLAPIAGLFVFGVGYGRLARKIAERKQETLADAVQFAEERLSAIRTVRTFNAEKHEFGAFQRCLDRVYAAGRQNALATGGMSGFFVCGTGFFLIHVIYNCGLMVSSGVVSIGTTVSLAMYCFMAGSSYTGVLTAYGDIQKGLGACQKVVEILRGQVPSHSFGEATMASSTDFSTAPMVRESIEPLSVRFENVSFAYPARPNAPVLNDLNLDILAGSRIALLGRSGSGKSTVAALLAGLYAPSAGRVLVDGIDIFAVPSGTVWARAQMGIISQEPTLFGLSIQDNVAYGLVSHDHNVGDEAAAVVDAVRAARVEEFAMKLPQGLETPAGERGQMLSGGQKQRVCIARALTRKPRMLIFDEATSALDLRSERLVHAALQDILAHHSCTCLIITHRMSALQWMDYIAFIDEGHVAQFGTRDEVLSNPCAPLNAILRNED